MDNPPKCRVCGINDAHPVYGDCCEDCRVNATPKGTPGTLKIGIPQRDDSRDPASKRRAANEAKERRRRADDARE